MENSDRYGIGFCELLCLMFIGLKLAGFITWPWVWVLCPIWVPIAIAALAFIASTCVSAACDMHRRKR